MMRGLGLALLTSGCFLDLRGIPCGDDSQCPRGEYCDRTQVCRAGSPPSTRVQSVAVTPASPVVAKGATIKLRAMATYVDGSMQDVTELAQWSSEDRSIADVSDALGTRGSVKAGLMGAAVITASLDGVSASTPVTVIAAALVRIELSPSNPSIARGTTRQLVALGVFSDDTTREVSSLATWSTSDDAIATVSNAVGSRGVVDALEPGAATVSANVDEVMGSTVVFVGPPALVSIQLTPPNPAIAVGTTRQLIATGLYSDQTTQDLSSLVLWASSEAAVATVSNVSGTRGLLSAVGPGSSAVSATQGGVTGSTLVVVTSASLTGLAVTPTNATIARGTTRQLTATASFSDGTVQELTSLVAWSSSSPSVVSVSSSAGTQGLASGLSAGTATITASLSGTSGTTALTVTDATISAVAVTPANPSMARGSSLQFSATATFTDSTVQDVTGAASWMASNTVVSVSDASGSKGLVSANAVGTSGVSATVSGVRGETTVTVTGASLSSISLTPSSPTLGRDTSQQFLATGSYSDGSTQDLTNQATWSSSVPAIVSVSNAAGSKGLATALATGTANLSAVVGSTTGTTSVTVSAATLTSLSIAPQGASAPRGATLQFTVTGHYLNGSTQDLTDQASWSTTNAAVATISNASGSRGLATALNVGATTIGATFGGVSAMTSLSVTAAVLESISLTPTDPSIARFALQQFTATGNYSDGTMLPLTQTVTWSSSNPAAATISNAAGSRGRASAVAPGLTNISATSGGVTGQTTLTVF